MVTGHQSASHIRLVSRLMRVTYQIRCPTLVCMASDKPTKLTGRPLGPTGETVRKRIKDIREDQRMAVTELSAKMSELGRPIPPLGIHRIEGGERRVDVDDLMAFAVALRTSPIGLLMPQRETRNDDAEVTGERRRCTADQIWLWLCADEFGFYPAEFESPEAFLRRTWPQWFQEQHAARLNEIDGIWAGLQQETLKLQREDAKPSHGDD
jgi:transcriptional regulator with XRE-family HTH domain